MKEPVEVAQEIENCIRASEKLCAKLDGIGKAKVDAGVNYDMEYEIALKQLEADGVPATTSRKRAEGILARKGITRILGMAEVRYKALHTKIDACEKALDGWRSYNRHLDYKA